jgi:hypothetical protein
LLWGLWLGLAWSGLVSIHPLVYRLLNGFADRQVIKGYNRF